MSYAFKVNAQTSERINLVLIMDDKKRKRLTVALFILLGVLVVGIIICLILLSIKKPSEDDKLVPDYPPQETESNQTPMEGDPGGTLEVEEGGAGVNLTYTATATVDLSEGKVKLYYANPSKSTQDMVISLVIEKDNTVLCRSQRITPGNQVRELPLDENAKSMLAAGGYNAKYVVGCYDPSTGEKAIVELVGSGVLVTVEE